MFAEFYKDLYSKKNDEIKTTCDHPDDDIEDGESKTDTSQNSPEKN